MECPDANRIVFPSGIQAPACPGPLTSFLAAPPDVGTIHKVRSVGEVLVDNQKFRTVGRNIGQRGRGYFGRGHQSMDLAAGNGRVRDDNFAVLYL